VTPVPAYRLLLIAIVFETVATSALKASDGFTRAGPSVLSILCYVLSFYLLSLTLRTIPVGIAYAIWAGLGIVLIAVIGAVVFGQRLDWPAVAGMGLIVAGIVVINVFSRAGAH
jgi:small multidrug resistance pump